MTNPTPFDAGQLVPPAITNPQRFIPLTCVLCGDAFQWDTAVRGPLKQDEDSHTCAGCWRATAMCSYYNCPTVFFTYTRRRGEGAPRFCSHYDRSTGQTCRSKHEALQLACRSKEPGRPDRPMPERYSSDGMPIRCRRVKPDTRTMCGNATSARSQLKIGQEGPVLCADCTASERRPSLAPKLAELEARKARRSGAAKVAARKPVRPPASTRRSP